MSPMTTMARARKLKYDVQDWTWHKSITSSSTNSFTTIGQFYDNTSTAYNANQSYTPYFTTTSTSTPPVPARRTAPKEFNRYINASDLLEEFIAFLGECGARQGDVMSMPIEFFIKWVIIRACEEDGEEANVVLEIPKVIQPRCLGCGQFMRKDTKLALHGPDCSDRHFERRAIAA